MATTKATQRRIKTLEAQESKLESTPKKGAKEKALEQEISKLIGRPYKGKR